MSNMVSVIIPAYNADPFIEEALASVYAQKHRDFEVIVVDDGSTDETVEIVRTYQAKLRKDDPALIFISQANGGPSRARNTGIKEAQGEFIAFLDADDLWLPDSLALMVVALEKHPQCGLVFGDASSFDEKGILTASVFNKNGQPQLHEDGCVLRPFKALLEMNFILTGAMLMRRTCLLEVGCFDESIRYGEDADVWLRTALHSSMLLIPKVILYRRIHEGNSSNVAINKKDKFDYLAVKIYVFRKILNEYGKRYRWITEIVDSAIMKTKKQRAYWFYLNGKYFLSLIMYLNYYLSKIKLAVIIHD